MCDNVAGRDAPDKQSQNTSKTPNASNSNYLSEVWINKIFNTNKNAGMIAREVLESNKKKNTLIKPNLKHSRSRTSSESDSGSVDGTAMEIEPDFKKPRKTAKISKTSATSEVTTNNSYSALSDNDDTVSDTSANNGKNHKPKRKHTQPPKINQEQAAPKPTPKIRAPPIFLQITGVKTTIEFLKAMNIAPTDFLVREFDDKFTRVYPGNIEVYNKIIGILKVNNAKYFTYTPRQLKIKTIVLKGIRGGYDEIAVKSALDELHLNEVNITKVSKMIFDKTKPSLYHFLVSVTHDSLTASLTRTKKLLSQPIRWERLRKPTIFMCKRCQQTGHSSSNCHLAPNCVKCAGEHESKDCTLKDVQDRGKLKCINCNEIGHPASYQGCPALKLLAEAKKADRAQNIIRKRNITHAINNYVNPNLTYANKTNANRRNDYFPPLPRKQKPGPGYNWPFEEPQETPQHPNTNNSDQNIGNIENLLNSFKAQILHELKVLNTKIDNNTNRIDQIMADIYMTE